ncbi:MAG: hypothetical protein ACTSYI_05490 [Promethearchaeota archaeon]
MTRRTRTSTTSSWNLARTLTAIGGLVALIGFALELIQSLVPSVNLTSMLYSLLGMLISFCVLLQVQIVRTQRFEIPFNWWMLLILAILQAFCANATSSIVDITGLGILLEIIAIILLLLSVL